MNTSYKAIANIAGLRQNPLSVADFGFCVHFNVCTNEICFCFFLRISLQKNKIVPVLSVYILKL